MKRSWQFFFVGFWAGVATLILVGNIRIITWASITADGKFIDIQEQNLFQYLEYRGYKRTTRRITDWEEAWPYELWGATFTASGKGGFFYQPTQVEWNEISVEEARHLRDRERP